jgi:hypothetical protein
VDVLDPWNTCRRWTRYHWKGVSCWWWALERGWIRTIGCGAEFWQWLGRSGRSGRSVEALSRSRIRGDSGALMEFKGSDDIAPDEI